MAGKDDHRSIILLTGLSGAGKSSAGRALEDAGYYYVDNLPAPLILPLLEFLADKEKIVISVDVRSWKYLQDFPAVWKEIKERCSGAKMIFLWSDPDVLARRYRTTRRPHPLQEEGSLIEAIRKEVTLLDPIRRMADSLLETTSLNVHQLRSRLLMEFGKAFHGDGKILLTFQSFGFAYGIPANVDMVFDVRFLPNPYFVAELQTLSGLDVPVADYVFLHEETNLFFEKLTSLIDFVLEEVKKEHRAYFGIGVGCTGGRHRSVAIVEKLSNHYADRNIQVTTQHRDLDRGTE